MTGALQLSAQQIDTLYPCYLLTDAGLVLRAAGRSISRLLPDLAAGDPLHRWFVFERPLSRFDPHRAAQDRTALQLRSQDGRVQLTGNVLALDVGFLFCVSHSLRAADTWGDLGLSLDDFCNADPSLAASNAMGIQKALMADLQEVVDKLQLARDEARAANQAKSTFLSAMSHEIRTPLNGVLGMTQAMLRDAEDPQLKSRLDIVRRSGEAVLAILNDLLDLARIESGRMTLESLEFDLGEVLDGGYATFTGVANSKGLSFGLDVAAAAGRYRGDPGRVRQIVYNLVSNAVKFTESGQVRVEAGRTDLGVEIRVSDTGIGIAAERLNSIFDEFTQADVTITRRFGGAGLGLAITRDLVRLMGGEIAVDSREGEGTCFTVQLPLERLGDPAPKTPEPDARDRQHISAPAPALRLLAAEDNAMNQLVLRTLLEQIGITPELVANGEEAIAAWRDGAWDLILMDIQMPVLDGVAASRRIRELEQASGRAATPIIALTANTMRHQTEEYEAAGMTAVVSKPIRAEALIEAIQACLEAGQAA